MFTLEHAFWDAPTAAYAKWCFDQYFAELNARFDAGFDPVLSIPADAHELTPPYRLLPAATSELAESAMM